MAIKDEELRLDIIVNGNKGQKAILELDAAQRKLKNTNDDLRSSKKSLEAQGKKNTKEYKKLTEEIKANNTTLKANKKTIDEHKKAIGLSALSSKQLKQEQRKLQSQLANTVKSLQPEAYAKYEKQLSEVNAELGKLNTNGKKTGGIIGKMKANAGGLAGIFAGAFSVGAVIQFGKSVADGVAELRSVKSTLQQITGLKGLALTKATVGIKALADTYDKETKEMTIATHNFAEGMEIDFDSAQQLVKQGFLDGADANEEFLDKLREYPVLLKEAGFSADEAVALMTQEVKTGVYSDKGVDAIKEANLRLREMPKSTTEALDAIGISSKTVQEELTNGSKTTFDIMQQVSKKLSELPPQSAEVGTAIADIFGGPGEDAGLKYLANLQNIDLTTGSLTTTTNEYLEAQKQELAANEAMNLVWIKLTGTGSAISTMYSKLRLGVAELLGGQQSLTQTFEDQAANVLNLNDTLIPLADEYDTLKSKSELSNNEQTRLKTVIGQIAEITPNAITAFDEYGNALDISSDKARDFIETQKALLSYQNRDALADNKEHLAKIESDLRIKQKALDFQTTRKDKDLASLQESIAKNTIKLQNEVAELRKLEAGALENIDRLSGDYLEKFKQREEEKTKLTFKETKKRADALGIEYSEEATAAEINALIVKQQQIASVKAAAGKLSAEQYKALQEQNKKKLIALEDKYEKDKLKRLAESNEQKAVLLKDQAIQEATELGAKQELLDAIEAEHKIKIKEAEKLDDEIELQRVADLEARKKEILNAIELEDATTKEEEDALKLTHKLEKDLLELQGIEEHETQKAEIKKAIIAKYNQDIDKLTENAAVKRAKAQAKFDVQEINFETQKNQIKIGLAQQLGNTLSGVLGDSLGAQLAAIAFNAIIEIAKLKIATASAQAINLANATATLPPPGNVPFIAAAVAQNITLGANSKLQQASIIGSAAISGLGATLSKSKKKGHEEGLYPVQRTDGKWFNSKQSNSSHTQMVTQPTYFSDGNYLAGEGGPEIIIDTPTLKNLHPSVIENIYATASRTRGYEVGKYETNETTTENNETSGLDLAFLTQVLIRIDTKLDMPLISGPVNIGDNEIQRQQDRLDKLKQNRENAKIN